VAENRTTRRPSRSSLAKQMHVALRRKCRSCERRASAKHHRIWHSFSLPPRLWRLSRLDPLRMPAQRALNAFVLGAYTWAFASKPKNSRALERWKAEEPCFRIVDSLSVLT
jgi:hypothetical protein